MIHFPDLEAWFDRELDEWRSMNLGSYEVLWNPDLPEAVEGDNEDIHRLLTLMMGKISNLSGHTILHVFPASEEKDALLVTFRFTHTGSSLSPINKNDLDRRLEGWNGYLTLASDKRELEVNLWLKRVSRDAPPVNLEEMRRHLSLTDAEARQVIEALLQDGKERFSSIREAFAGSDWDRLLREAHALKGSASNVKARELQKKSHELEKACRKHRVEERHIEDVAAAWDRVAAWYGSLPVGAET